LYEAEALLRDGASRRGGPGSEEAARAALDRALELVPGWVAPRRLQDEIARADLRGVDALRAHRAALAADPHDAGELYLTGRLEGNAGEPRFEQAVRDDPGLAWGHHGLSWAAAARGDRREAVVHAQNALDRARDPWERTFFTLTLARQLVSAERRDEALELLDERAAAEDVPAYDRARIAAQSVQLALESSGMRLGWQAYERGIEILRNEDLPDSDVEQLAARMRARSWDDPDDQRLSLALAARKSPARDRLRAELMLQSGATPLALGLLERALQAADASLPAGTAARAARFGAGDFGGAVERWLAALPAVVLDGTGLPRDERLARVVRAARACATSLGHKELFELGEALIAAGWYREARGVAVRLASADLDGALSLDDRALAGIELLDELRRVMRRVDRAVRTRPPTPGVARDELRPTARETVPALLATQDESPPLASLDSLLDSLAPIFAHADAFLSGETDERRLRREILDSPRRSYAGLAEVVHPGPRFSEEDDEEGLGRAGERVGGLAALLDRHGRFGLFGEMAGAGGPDATVLPLLGWEERKGQHLGVKWHGTVAWCESADVKSRAGRRGAQISAAALHEGYWVDIDSVREEWGAWTALRRRFAPNPDVVGPAESWAEAAQRIEAALASGGLSLEGLGGAESERLATGALLNEAQRVRLAVLRDRVAITDPDQDIVFEGVDDGDGRNSVLGEMTLDELVAVTCTHEEGHLCDRTRFLPVFAHKMACFALLLDCFFSPVRVGEELEYRAQLTCIAEVADPRIPLAQVLDSVEAGSAGITPHGGGYARLLQDLLQVLDQDASGYPELDRGSTLAHQLHRLPPESVRRAALALAKRKGMM
jgi:tetratricopeptide (TPR) repeat protein